MRDLESVMKGGLQSGTHNEPWDTLISRRYPNLTTHIPPFACSFSSLALNLFPHLLVPATLICTLPLMYQAP